MKREIICFQLETQPNESRINLYIFKLLRLITTKDE